MGAVILVALAAMVLFYILVVGLVVDAEVTPRELIIADLRAQVAAYEAERAEPLFRRPARWAA